MEDPFHGDSVRRCRIVDLCRYDGSKSKKCAVVGGGSPKVHTLIYVVESFHPSTLDKRKQSESVFTFEIPPTSDETFKWTPSLREGDPTTELIFNIPPDLVLDSFGNG